MSCYMFSISSPAIKLSDAGFLHTKGSFKIAEIYTLGVAVLKLELKQDKILNGACDNKEVFNKKIFLTRLTIKPC